MQSLCLSPKLSLACLLAGGLGPWTLGPKAAHQSVSSASLSLLSFPSLPPSLSLPRSLSLALSRSLSRSLSSLSRSLSLSLSELTVYTANGPRLRLTTMPISPAVSCESSASCRLKPG